MSTSLADDGDDRSERLANAVNMAVMLLTRKEGLSAEASDGFRRVLDAERKRQDRAQARMARSKVTQMHRRTA